MTSINEIKSTMNFHHGASRRGYESRKGNGHVEEYNGKFGKGYIIVTPRFDTTQYVNIDYYVEK